MQKQKHRHTKAYYNDLYNNVLLKYLNKHNKLKLITGFSSSSFLKRLLEDVPNAELEIYIGMSRDGIPRRDHETYLDIVSKNNSIKIYYQIKGVPNHMKLYSFESTNDGDNIVFIGSANFSENGFLKYQEILGTIDLNISDIFETQRLNSLKCNDLMIEQYIKLVKDENLEGPVQDDEHVDDNQVYEASNISRKKIISHKDFLSQFRRIEYRYYREFNFPIVYPKERDSNWYRTGINSWIDNKKPVLKQNTVNIEFENVFPINDFKIYTDDEMVFTAYIGGRFNREIHFKDINIYKYIIQRLHIDKKGPISYLDLKERNFSHVFFTRLNKREYFVSFKNKS